MRICYSKIVVLYYFLAFILSGCQSSKPTPEPYLRWVGDIVQDNKRDAPTFELCDEESEVHQYFNTSQGVQYEGEKQNLHKIIRQAYTDIPQKGESGWIRIRFIVNCQRKAGRFRVLEADEHYQPKKFDERITTQLLEIVKKLDGWQTITSKNDNQDYYMYLIFKLKDGHLIEILP